MKNSLQFNLKTAGELRDQQWSYMKTFLILLGICVLFTLMFTVVPYLISADNWLLVGLGFLILIAFFAAVIDCVVKLARKYLFI